MHLQNSCPSQLNFPEGCTCVSLNLSFCYQWWHQSNQVSNQVLKCHQLLTLHAVIHSKVRTENPSEIILPHWASFSHTMSSEHMHTETLKIQTAYTATWWTTHSLTKYFLLSLSFSRHQRQMRNKTTKRPPKQNKRECLKGSTQW